MPVKIALLASGELGCEIGIALANSKHHLEAVFYPPARPAGRGNLPCLCPVGSWSKDKGYSCVETSDLKKDEVAKKILLDLKPDIIVVADFGQFIPDDIIKLPRLGCINVHPSLLPKYRGAAPVNWAIINGDKTTGVTILFVTKKMDAGDIILQQETPIGEDETAAELAARLRALGAELIIKAIDQLEGGSAKIVAQDESKVVLAPKLSKDDGLIDWKMDATAIVNRVRGLLPWPGTFTKRAGKLLHIRRAKVQTSEGKPGIVLEAKNKLIVAAGKGSLEILEIQPEGKKAMDASSFINGYRPSPDETWGE